MTKKRQLSNQISSKKIKVLMYADAMTCATGFSTVSRNIAEALYKTGRYDIDVFGINYHGDPHGFPYRIWPAGVGSRDPYGRERFVNMATQLEYDILFLLQDSFILDFMPKLLPALKQQGKKFRSICYYPIDAYTPKEQWIKNVIAADYVYTYTKFGVDKSKEACTDSGNIGIIHHGANVTDFRPLPENDIDSFKQAFFGANKDKFIITNVGRNQHRKDMPRTIAAFKEFRKEVPNSVLYLHCAARDQGWNLDEVVKTYGFNTKDDVLFPDKFGPNQGYPIQVLNMVYNASDLVVSSNLGEGHGLAWTEAMAVKTPVLMPNNTSMAELITEDKGYLCDSGTNPSLFTILPHDNEMLRPLVDVEDMAKKMVHIYNNYEEAKAKAEVAYKWVSEELNWQGNIGKQWVEVFDKAALDLLTGSAQPEVPVEGSIIQAESF